MNSVLQSKEKTYHRQLYLCCISVKTDAAVSDLQITTENHSAIYFMEETLWMVWLSGVCLSEALFVPAHISYLASPNIVQKNLRSVFSLIIISYRWL